MIDLTINDKQLKATIQCAKERHIIIPTFREMKNPDLIPESIKKELGISLEMKKDTLDIK